VLAPSDVVLDPVVEFHSLQYSLCVMCFVPFIVVLLVIVIYIVWYRRQAQRAVAGRRSFKQSQHAVRCLSRVILEGRSTGIMPFESGPVPTDGRSGYAVFIDGMLHTVWGFSNCNVSCVFGHADRCYGRSVCVLVVLSGVTICLGREMLDTASVDSVYKPHFVVRWFTERNLSVDIGRI
jgi:hypothetical protein